MEESSVPPSLDQSYDAYPRIESEFQAALDESLEPRGSEQLYDLVRDLGLPAGALAVDVGCGEGGHSINLAGRYGFRVLGIDPVKRHIDLANAERDRMGDPDLSDRVEFKLGTAEALPVADASVDLVWCRDVLYHVEALDKAYAEFRRVLRQTGKALVYQWFATDRLEPREAARLWQVMGIVPANADPRRTERAITSAGLHIRQRIDFASEWGERAEEDSGHAGRRLLHAARLLRAPERYRSRFGDWAYDIMLGDCLWHVYRMIGKLNPRAYVLERERG